ncbi:MAG: 1,4-dihydroxy-2-naphthoate polyprenyltransferase [Bacillota bacterium]|nr:1,4-dihydroxy-2-naphthoate polyprenyltransferase [Bacillota bacterium]
MKGSVWKSLLGLGLLMRWPAILAWSGGGIFLAAGLARDTVRLPGAWTNLGLLALVVLLLHGVVSHAVNDCADWASGTDRLSPRLLSGGSRVIPRGLLGQKELARISAKALFMALVLATVLFFRLGPGVLVPLAIGLWAPLAYSLPPLALAYRPFLGEWLGAFPALLATTLGAYWVLTGAVTPRSGGAAFIYGLLCQAWLAEHHLADIGADLKATPRKLTTAAWVSLRWGLPAARFVPALYAGAAVAFALGAAAYWGASFAPAVVPASASCLIALASRPHDVSATTRAEITMMALALLTGWFLGWLV